MKNFIHRAVVVVFVSLLMACSNTFEFVERVFNPPAISLDEKEILYERVDSVKTSLKTASEKLTRSILLLPGTKGELSQINILNPDNVPLRLLNEVVTDNIPAEKGKLVTLTAIVPTQTTKTFTITFTGQNKAGKVGEQSSVLTLVAFANLPPKAAFTATCINPTESKVDYLFDASACLDQDAKFGGVVSSYEYTIKIDTQTQTILTNSKLLRHGFHLLGNYTITLIAYDNDGAASSPVTINVTVQ